MPFKSKAQQRFMFAAESRGDVPEGTAERWAHHTKNIKKLPEHVKGHSGRRGKKKESADLFASLGQAAADLPYVVKLAGDSELDHAQVYGLAEFAGLPVREFVKRAYADVPAYIALLKAAAGADLTREDVLTLVKSAAPLGGLFEEGSRLAGILAKLKGWGGAAAGSVGQASPGVLAKLKDWGGAAAGGVGRASQGLLSAGSDPTKGLFRTGVGRGITESPGLSTAVAAPGALATGGGLVYGANKLRGGGGDAPGPTETSLQDVQQAAPALNPAQQGGGGAPAPAKAPAEAPAQAPAGGGGMSPLAKALALGGGTAALGTGAYMLARRRRRDKEKESEDALVKRAMVRAIAKRANDLCRHHVCQHLDGVAKYLPLHKQASVRVLQHAVAAGRPLSVAIKLAYPQLSGEGRGILATRIVKSAMAAR